MWKQHPSEITSIYVGTQSDKDIDIKIYMDGPDSKELVGAAFVVFNDGGSIIDTSKIKLPKHSNNFEAEGVAILKAIEFVLTQREGQRVQILTDSVSSFRALGNQGNQNELINQIKGKYTTVKYIFTLYLTYVKAYSGISGNEIADDLAKY